tara:strand:+ start:26199 stop:26942 length:744 start_codon:yes stop_codon:yes gene_type:complete
MKLLLKNICILSIFFTIICCNHKIINEDVKKSIVGLDLFTSGQEPKKIYGTLSNNRIIMKYYSISEHEFYNAIENTKHKISFLSSEYYLGERFNTLSKRNGDTLRLSLKNDSILIDTHGSHPVKYFYENKVGKFHMVMKFSFEDAKTLFISDNCNNVVSDIVNVVSNNDGDMIFASSNEQEFTWDSTQVVIARINDCQIDTLINYNPHWFSKFTFFNNKNEIYLAHTEVENNGDYTVTPVKMEIKSK